LTQIRNGAGMINRLAAPLMQSKKTAPGRPARCAQAAAITLRRVIRRDRQPPSGFDRATARAGIRHSGRSEPFFAAGALARFAPAGRLAAARFAADDAC